MDPQILDALTELLGRESHSANIYQNLVTFFHTGGLPGYSNRMQLRIGRKQARVTQIQNFISSFGTSPGRIPSPAPIPVFTDPIAALTFINNYQIETKLLMNRIIAMEELPGGITTTAFVRNLVEEQTEEEATASELLERTRIRYSGPMPRNIQLKAIDYNLP